MQAFELLRRGGGEHVLHNVHGQHVYVVGRAHEDQGLVLFVAADQVNVERHKKVADLEIGFFFKLGIVDEGLFADLEGLLGQLCDGPNLRWS